MGVVVDVVAGGDVGVAGVVVVVVVVPGVPGVSGASAAGATGVVVLAAGSGVVAAGTDGVDGSIGASLENMSVKTSHVPSRFTQVTTDLPWSVTEEPADELLY